MKNQQTEIKQLGNALRCLNEFVPCSKAELKQWYEQARRLEAEHLKGGEDYLDVPNFVWHYLSDADIRMKDEIYAEMQGRRFNLLLQYLEQGVMPSEEDTYV